MKKHTAILCEQETESAAVLPACESDGGESDILWPGADADAAAGSSPLAASTGQVAGVEFFFVAAVCLMYLTAWWLTHILGLPDNSVERAEILFTCFVCFNCMAAFMAWKGLQWIPTRGLVHEISRTITAAVACAAVANLIDLGLWLGLGRTLKDSNIPHFFFILAILLGTVGMFKVARLWRTRFGGRAALLYAVVLAFFCAIMYSSGITRLGPDLLDKPNARDVLSSMLYAVLNSFIGTLALYNWIHSRGKLSTGIRLISIGTFLLSLGCVIFAIISANYPVHLAAAHPVHLLLGVSYMLIGLGVYRIGLTIVDTIDGQDENLPPVSPLIEIFGENAGWKLYNRVVAKIRASELRLGRTLRENREKTESIQALESTLLTESKVREELCQAKEKAEAANAAKTQFLTMMSHELRTPLTAILGYASLLADPPKDNLNTRDYGSRIRNSAQHLQQLIETILDFSSIESGRFRFRPATFPLAEIVDFAQDLGETLSKSRKISFAFSAPSEVVMLHSDPMMMRQILANVLANAFKFTDSGDVRLEVTTTGTTLRFRVTDTGIGIPESEQERIFEPFFQISRGSTRSFGGVGLGLSIVKRLSEILKGSVSIESQFGKGTRITIELAREVR